MVSMVFVGGFLAVAGIAALVLAELGDRRRAIRVASDRSRIAGPVADPVLPWLR